LSIWGVGVSVYFVSNVDVALSLLLGFNFAEGLEESLHWCFWVFLLVIVFKTSVVLKISSGNIWFFKVRKLNIWPFARKDDLTLLESENNKEGEDKHKNRNDGNSSDSTIVVGTNNISIFPNDVRWFSGLGEHWFLSHDCSVHHTVVNVSLVVKNSLFAER
jgi:hypothetical protein|tara:strand:+ start:273 stop:755 length:483 start_codon:yes stop_codon:yes gene_type:complete